MAESSPGPHPAERCDLVAISGTELGPKNGGSRLSWHRCETKENKNGKGPARLSDSPMGYLDPEKDGAGSLCAIFLSPSKKPFSNSLKPSMAALAKDLLVHLP